VDVTFIVGLHFLLCDLIQTNKNVVSRTLVHANMADKGNYIVTTPTHRANCIAGPTKNVAAHDGSQSKLYCHSKTKTHL